VLVHRGLATLDVLCAGLLLIAVFDVMLGGLRSYVLQHTTSRIDVLLGARLFRHLLRLPLAWFEARRIGDTVARVRELDGIRRFLTGAALTLAIDLLFVVVFFGVMLVYSTSLSVVVLASLPCYALLALAVSPVLRRRLDEQSKPSPASRPSRPRPSSRGSVRAGRSCWRRRPGRGCAPSSFPRSPRSSRHWCRS
jgi:ATP-binding cassette, subfamily B, bacterial HlyB/CyaB